MIRINCMWLKLNRAENHFCKTQLKLEAEDGKKYSTDCAHTEGLFRVIQTIPI